MLEHSVISAITLDEGTFVLCFRVTGKRRGEGKGAEGEYSRDDLGREAHLEK